MFILESVSVHKRNLEKDYYDIKSIMGLIYYFKSLVSLKRGLLVRKEKNGNETSLKVVIKRDLI